MAAIDLINLTKFFGSVKAVNDLTLTISDKEFVALLGPSGCGKTTTMNMISGIEQPTAGSINFNGVDVSHVPPGRRGIGFVFQNYAIFTHMTVRANLAFGLEIRREPPAEIARKVADMAALMRLSDKLDRAAGRLNVNEMQRLAIGRSAIVHPDIFLLDEPLSNLDAAFRAEMRTELKHLQREIKQTMVYVTHDQIEAMSMADRIAVINLGVLQQYASPIEIYNNPANLFVAKFIGSPSMKSFEMPPLDGWRRYQARFRGGRLHRSDRSQVGGAEPPGAQAGRGFRSAPRTARTTSRQWACLLVVDDCHVCRESWRPHHCASGARRSNPESGRKERLSSRARRTEVGDRATGCGNAI